MLKPCGAITYLLCSLSLVIQSPTKANELQGSIDCQSPVWPVAIAFVGEWTLTIEADEGWTGYGESSFSLDPLRPCSVIEKSTAVFNRESETPIDNRTTSLITWDALSGDLKIVSSDDRGYVHLGQGSLVEPGMMAFNILRGPSLPSNRRIVFRDIEQDQFTWAWQGRPKVNNNWKDRLVIVYTRLPRD